MNILIIDDDRFVTKTLECSLTANGYKVDVINKSADVAKNISSLKKYDCILLDLMMRSAPELDIHSGEETGEAIFRMIKRQDKNKPVIIITGKDVSDIKTDFSSLNTQVIGKPFHSRLEDIYKALKNV